MRQPDGAKDRLLNWVLGDPIIDEGPNEYERTINRIATFCMSLLYFATLAYILFLVQDWSKEPAWWIAFEPHYVNWLLSLF